MPALKGKPGIKAFLLKNVGRIVNTKDIQKASGNQSEHARRVREIRDEEGWPIQTNNDTSELKPGEYRLTHIPDEKPQPVFSRRISTSLRTQALERNGFTCQWCGVGAGDKDKNGRPIRLHVHHIIPKTSGGYDRLDNLRALCSQCNQGAKNVTEAPPGRIRVMAILRKANREDQRHAYAWLRDKLGKIEK